MKHLFLIAIIIAAFFNCSLHRRTAGTADDVNNGSLFGQLLTDAPVPLGVSLASYGQFGHRHGRQRQVQPGEPVM